MKRFVGIFLTACILTTVFAGCSSISDDGNSSNAGDDTVSTASIDEAAVSQAFAELDKTELNVTEVADALKNGIEFTDELSEVSLEMALTRYGLTAEQVTEGKIYQKRRCNCRRNCRAQSSRQVKWIRSWDRFLFT